MVAAADARITFLGHSTMIVEMDGVRVLTDPILRPRVGPLVRLPKPVDGAVWSSPDAIVISHSHWDHLDFGSLRMVGPDTHLIMPKGLSVDPRFRGFSRISEVGPGDDVEIGGVRVEATYAEHHGFGPPIGGSDLAIGFVFHGSRRAYFAGDTAFFEGMSALDIGLDVALVPVWGWGPTAKPSDHLDPLGAARAVAVIKPRLAIPIHWGTLHPLGFRWLRPTTRIDPPHQFAQLVRRFAPATRARVLPVGSSIDLADVLGR